MRSGKPSFWRRWHFELQETNALILFTPWFCIWLGHEAYHPKYHALRTGITVLWSPDWTKWKKAVMWRREWEHALRMVSMESVYAGRRANRNTYERP